MKKQSLAYRKISKNRRLKKRINNSGLHYPSPYTLRYMCKKYHTMANSRLRVLDFMFPKQEVFINPTLKNSNVGLVCKPFSYLKYIKRIVKIEKRNDYINLGYNNFYIMTITEKLPSQQVWKGYENLFALNSSLKEFDTPISRILQQKFADYVTYIEDQERYKSQINFDGNKNQKRVEISQHALNYIRFTPYIMLKFNYNLQNLDGQIVEIETNSKMLQLIGYNDNYFMSHFTNFEIFQNFVSKNWMRFFSVLLEFITDANDNSKDYSLTNEELSLRSIEGGTVQGFFRLYKQRYIQYNSMLEEIYQVFYIESNADALTDIVDLADHKNLMLANRQMFDKILKTVQKEGVRLLIEKFY